ncbi:MAG TPA: cyclase family protein [Solirubrobacterales bacterium]|nr:cyclase family protein [Solirubrobacterales bacterium]
MPRIVDLTQPLGPETVLWPGSKPVEVSTVATIAADGHFAQTLHLPEHSGTHLDAPAHFVAGGQTVDEIAAESLVLPCAVLDVRERTAADPDFALDAADLDELERSDGRIEPGSAVLLATGWDAHIDDPARYLGGEEAGHLRFPGFGAGAARALVARGVAGIGIDTVSVDRGSDTGFPVHRITLPAGLWHLEGLVGIGALPARGATLVVGALPVRGGSGAPARVVAIVP